MNIERRLYILKDMRILDSPKKGETVREHSSVIFSRSPLPQGYSRKKKKKKKVDYSML